MGELLYSVYAVHPSINARIYICKAVKQLRKSYPPFLSTTHTERKKCTYKKNTIRKEAQIVSSHKLNVSIKIPFFYSV